MLTTKVPPTTPAASAPAAIVLAEQPAATAIIVANVAQTAAPTKAKKAARFHRAGQVRVVAGSSTKDSGNRERIGPRGTRRVPSASCTTTGPISQPDLVRS